MAYADSLRINIDIGAMYILTSSILDVSDTFQNTNVPIHERVCVSPPPYYLYWFERCYPNFLLNKDGGPFCLQFMNVIQGTKTAGLKCYRLFDTVVTVIKYKKITIDHDI